MSWDLTDEQQAAIMEAVAEAIEPWLWVDPDATVTAKWHKGMFEGRPIPESAVQCEDDPDYYDYTFPQRMKVLRPEAPEEIKRLMRVFDDIVDSGPIVIGGPPDG